MNERKKPQKPRPDAVALRYDRNREAAPRLLAKGRGAVAEQIIKVAREQGIPVRHDPDLLELLAQVDLEGLVPPEAYRAVAELFAFLYRLNLKSPDLKSQI